MFSVNLRKIAATLNIVRQGFLIIIYCNSQGMKFFQDFPDEDNKPLDNKPLLKRRNLM
jgi:hypothetical protein